MNRLHVVGFAAGIAALCSVILADCGRPQAGDYVPALRITAPNGQQSTIIGSMHVAFEGLRQPSSKVFDGAKLYVIESSATQGPQPHTPDLREQLDPDVFRSLLETGKMSRASWTNWISDQQVARLKEQLVCSAPQLTDQADTAIQFMLGSKTARDAMAVAEYLCPPKGKLSRDQIMEAAAASHNIPTAVLETQTEAERHREAVPENVYEALLRRDLNDDQKKSYGQVVDALNVGDYGAILKALNQGADAKVESILYQRMVVDRNISWMPALRSYLDRGRAVVLVGAAHLPGPEGVINLLEKDGYKVAPIELQSQ